MRKLEDLLKALLKNGLKISPRKCQMFKKEPKYMGNTILIQEKRECVKPLQSRLEAIQNAESHPLQSKVVEVLQEWSTSLAYFVKIYKTTAKTHL